MDKNRIYEDINIVLVKERMTLSDAGKLIGNSQSSLSQKLLRGSMKYNEAIELFDKLGYKVEITKK